MSNRQSFEAWMTENKPGLRTYRRDRADSARLGEYCDHDAQIMWEAWQAAGAMNADSALRELVDKTRLDLAGGANGSYTAYEKGRIAEKRKWIHDLESILATPQAAPAGMVPVPTVCDGKEQDAFEDWAKSQKYDMETHPLHWLFLDRETYAARQGWAAAIRYVGTMLAAAPAAQVAYPSEGHGCIYPNGDGACQECGDLAAANKAASPAVVVDEAMVERAVAAYMENIAAQPTMTKLGRPAMRAALAAALSQGKASG